MSGRNDDCLHASTSPAYAAQGSACTLVVITCDDCGQKVSSAILR
jgi:hypothetical protein